MRIGIVCPYDLASPGGVQQLTSELAAKLMETGDSPVLIGAGRSSYEYGGPGPDGFVVPAGRPVFLKANDSVVPFTLSPGSWRRVRRALADVDVVHIHEPLVPLVGWAALMTGKPLVATFHADPAAWVHRAYRLVPLLARKFRRAVVTAVSETAARALPATWGEATIIPNAIDVASYRVPVGRIPRRVAFLGRDDPRKGLDVLLQAWPSVVEMHPDAQLVVMGATRPSQTRAVDFVGRVSAGEKRRLLASSSILVAPNLGGESFGIVVAEAMAAGCAVVASELPAFVSVLGDSGRLVPPGDPAGIASAVNDLLSHPETIVSMSQRSGSAVQRFDWPVVLEGYRAAYRRAVAM